MSTNKKFRIQNGADIHGGGLSIDDVIVIGADGKVVAGAIQEAVAELTAADIADLQAQVTAILGTSPETLDTLQEIVTAFQDADTNLVASVASNSSDIATINATLTSGVATPADVATLDTFVKGDGTSHFYVPDETYWTVNTNGSISAEGTLFMLANPPSNSTFGGAIVNSVAVKSSELLTVGEEYTVSFSGGKAIGVTNAVWKIIVHGANLTSSSSIIEEYEFTSYDDHSFTFTSPDDRVYISITTPSGDEPQRAAWVRNLDITSPSSLDTTATQVVPAINEVHAEVDALTVAVATAKSEAISTAAADATTKADDAKAYADQVVAATVDAAPAALDTLNELAAALGDDANFASTVTASIGSNTSAISSLDVFVGDGRTGPPNAITSIAASNWTVLQSGITITDNPDGSVTFTTDGSNAGEMAEILVDVDNVAYEFAANVVGYHATAHYLSTKRASDNASISGFAFNTGGSVGGNGSGWSNTSGYADQVKVIITFGTVAGGTSWTFNSISLYDPEAADAPALDTSAQTIADAVNEVHAELGALSATQSGDTSSLTSAIATAKSEAISTASADATAKADAAETDAKAYADQVVAATVDAAPAALDTLNELAAALGDDANFASTVTDSIATKASQVDHDAEVARATAAEGVNASAIAATNARTSGISTSSGSTDIQMTAEVDMDSNKVTNMADPTAAQDAATKAYVDAASTSSSSDLSAETAARIAADTNLQSQITALSGSTDGKDSDLQDAINAEESARIAADAVLQNNIDAEAAVRASADLALTGDISDEADARIAGDNAITAALNTEIGDRQSGDNALQTQIDFITSNTDPAALDSLTEIVAAFQSADDSITGVVTSNTTRISALEGSVTGIEAWNTDNVSEGTTNLYFTDARAKACLTGGLCITYNTTTGEISVDETEAESSLRVAESVASDDADKLDGQEGTYYRINVYNVAGTLVN
jgi:hypothetical protein